MEHLSQQITINCSLATIEMSDKMIIKCIIPAQSDIFISKLINGISATYFWNIYDDEIYITVNGHISLDSKQLFINHQLTSNSLNEITCQCPYWIVSCKLQASGSGANQEICTYDQFVHSDCDLVVSIFDTKYVTIFVKNNSDYNKLFENIKKWSFHNIVCVSPVTEDYRI